LQKSEAEYLPYFGKNDFSLWWENYSEHAYESFVFNKDYEVATIFMKSDQVIKEMVSKRILSPFATNDGEQKFMSFEELPVGFHEQLLQYEKRQFVFTNFTLSRELRLDGLYFLQGQNGLVQLF